MRSLVSIIIPVYNASKTIEKTIQSVLNQRYNNFEIIIIDDCSTDRSVEIIENLSKTDKRILIYKNKNNLGVSLTRNLGITIARGEFIAFLDSDDIWKPLKLQRQLDYIKKEDIDLCYTSYEIINDKNETDGDIRFVPRNINYNNLLKENIICCSTVVLKKKLLVKYNFKSDYFHEDFVLWLQLLKDGFKAQGINESLVLYRKGGRSSDKIKAFKNRWIVYRRSEKLNIFVSLYYIIFYAINGMKKYYFKFYSK
ncbi:glycosyltransferase family 2 protein [Clostridium sp. ZBS4]|uniref:glycosyltransferase family 2 protein n=1 Tax=Clostridium sp. ZBS4 TaxID=2949974 RepID=UPI00207965D6|nr:glycosyltransferase family 2 protein [Clostridium sp. ZBS4]